MLILIDKTNLRMVAATVTMAHMQLVAKHCFHEVATVVVDTEIGREWTALNQDEMRTLYANMSGQESPEYQVAIEQLRAYGRGWEVYPVPEADLAKLEPVPEPRVEEETAIPTGFPGESLPKEKEYVDPVIESDPDDEVIGEVHAASAPHRKINPEQLDIPEVSRATHQAIISGVEAMNQAAKGANPDAAAATKPDAAKKSTATAEPKAPSKPGATKRVWEIADALYATAASTGKGTDLKEIRKSVVAACEAEGINPGTAATQFGKWKHSKGF